MEEFTTTKLKMTSRFRDAEWMDTMANTAITIGGAGGIGSYTIQFLARQWPKVIYVYDMDNYEEVNAGSQFMTINELGINKGLAATKLAYEFSQYEDIRQFGEYIEGSLTSRISVAAFDNMKARKLMYESWKQLLNPRLFIDGRLTAESFEIYFVQYEEKYLKAYEETLFPDDEAEELACTLKATSHCGAMIGAVIVNGINNFLVNFSAKEQIREMPFMVRYDMELFNFETKSL